jgi:hypothetical protein
MMRGVGNKQQKGCITKGYENWLSLCVVKRNDLTRWLDFCNWHNGGRQLHRYILFTDEEKFNRDAVNNTHNSNLWADENPHATVQRNIQQRFSSNVRCAFLDDQLIGLFILEGCLTGEANLTFLQKELPRLLEDVVLSKRSRIYYQYG